MDKIMSAFAQPRTHARTHNKMATNVHLLDIVHVQMNCNLMHASHACMLVLHPYKWVQGCEAPCS